jgi:site-specific DNA-cytosine methylase
MKVLSLFDGMSCGQIALNRAGVPYDKYYASEIDPQAIKVTQHHFPNTIQMGDVCNVKASALDKIDLLIGGSPCQDLSFGSHTSLGLAGDRSGLFWQFIRIYNELKLRNPNLKVLLENVRMKQMWIDAISKQLGQYPVAINSALLSGQSRQRLYWTNINFDVQIVDKGIKLSDVLESGYVDREKSYCIDANYYKGGNLKRYVKKSSRQLVFLQPLKKATMETIIPYRKLTPLECERLQTLPDGYTSIVNEAERYKMIGNGWTVDVIAHILKNLK